MILIPSVPPLPDRRKTNFWNIALGVSSEKQYTWDYAVTISQHVFNVEDLDKTSEGQFGIDAQLATDYEGWRFKGVGEFYAHDITNSVSHENPLYSRFSINARTLLASRFDLSFGGNVFICRNTGSETQGKFYPQLGVQYYANNWLTLFASFEPMVRHNSVYRLMQTNRYLHNDIILRQTEEFVNLAFGFGFDVQAFKAKLYGSFVRARNYPIFVVADPKFYPYNVKGVWDLFYDGTTDIAELHTEGMYSISNEGNVSGTFILRNSKSSETDSQVPYLPVLEGSARYQHFFKFGLTLTASLQYIGQRRISLQTIDELTSYMLFDIGGEYRITNNVGFFATLKNIFNQKYYLWDNYEALPFTAMAGVSVRW
jgi:outer membrane receptor protein involved in Fe transport